MEEAMKQLIDLAKEVGGQAWPLLVQAQRADAIVDIISTVVLGVCITLLLLYAGRFIPLVADATGGDYECKCPGQRGERPCRTAKTALRGAQLLLLLLVLGTTLVVSARSIIVLNMPEVYAAKALLNHTK